MKTAALVSVLALSAPALATSPTTIVNTAKNVWLMIEKNRPTVGVRDSFACALPAEAKDWRELSGWSGPESSEHRLQAVDAFGATVADVRYAVVREWGGSRGGKGKYLANVAVIPLRVEAAWGYDVDVSVGVSGVVNAGTAEDPVAAMILELRWSISSALRREEGRDAFYLRGDGTLRALASDEK
ncbi:MAG TPA: hypothetical protein VNI01_15770 [Elusimicrobiota bacterium]|jgi:hypothetical protein|nr:hypothetical protein [Elusimicrobiota bacterium]